MPFLYNAWYAAGWSERLGDTPTRITILGEPVALYRGEDGAAAALGDICPHRFASLSQGRIVGEVLQCPYHGLRFDRAGACVHNPHGEGMVPPGARVRAYPLVERHHALWIWPGDPALADPDLIPDISVYDRDDIASSRDYLHVAADYRLVNDNLLDLTHAAFLHPFLASEEFASRSRTKVEQDGRIIRSMMWNDNETITPLFELVWDGEGDRVDLRSHMHWTAPSSLLLDVGVTAVGADPMDGPWLPSAHLLTPETETTTHYFWMVGRNRQLDNAELGRIIHGGIKQAFETEDEPMITQVSANMAGREFWSLHPAILAGDAAAVRARRLLAKLIREEEQPVVAEAAE